MAGAAVAVSALVVLGGAEGWWSDDPAVASGGSTADGSPGAGSSPPGLGFGSVLDLEGIGGGPDDGSDGAGADVDGGGPGSPVVERLLDPVGAGPCLRPGGGGASAEPVVIGVIVDEPVGLLPVVPADDVPVGVTGARLVAEAATCGGGVLDRPVEVVAVGAGGSPLAAVEAVSELLDRRPSVIIGPSSLEVGLRVVEVVGGRAPVVFPRSVDPALVAPSEGRFLLGPDAAVLGDAAAGHALAQPWRRAVLLVGESPSDELVADAFAAALEAGGGVVVTEVVVDDGGGVDPAEVLAAVEPSSPIQEAPEVVFAALGLEEAAAAVAVLHAAGDRTPVVAVDRRADLEPGFEVDVLDGLELVGWSAPSTDDTLDRFAAVVAAELSPAPAAVMAEARTADAALLAIEAVARAGGQEPAAVGEQLGNGLAVSGLAATVQVWPSPTVDAVADVVPVVRIERGMPVAVGSITVAVR